jgi:hypothetical protein
VILENGQADAIQGRFGRRKLLQDFDAESGLLDHPADSTNLTFDPVEARDERLLFCCSQHGLFRCSQHWSRLDPISYERS